MIIDTEILIKACEKFDHCGTCPLRPTNVCSDVPPREVDWLAVEKILLKYVMEEQYEIHI